MLSSSTSHSAATSSARAGQQGLRPAAVAHPAAAAAAAAPSRSPRSPVMDPRAPSSSSSSPSSSHSSSNVRTRAISRLIKLSDSTPSTTGTRSLRTLPTAQAARAMNRMLITNSPPVPPPSLAPTRREAMFGLFGSIIGGGAVATYFKSVYDVDLKAAEAALGVMLDDPVFLESVAQEVLYQEFHEDEKAVDTAISSEQQLEQELRAMTKQMDAMMKEVNEITQLAEARTAAARS